MLLITQLFSFLIPSLVFSWIAFKREMFTFLGFSGKVEFQWIIFALTMLVCLLPIIQFSYEMNQALPLPEWMTQMEDDASTTLEAIIKMDTVAQLMINIFLIALLPAIGEELVFRGVIQQIGYRLFQKPVVSVWVTAFIFSAIHFQFEGFIPRFLLGLYLGYIYFWTRSIYVPMAAHFFNNAFMVLLSFFKPEMIADIDETAAPDLPWYGVIVSIALIIPMIMYFRNLSIDTSDNQNTDQI